MNTILINKENASTRELEPLTENVIFSDNEEEQTGQTHEEYTKVNNFITEGIKFSSIYVISFINMLNVKSIKLFKFCNY